MSSVPVQLLIYVQPQPTCSSPPLALPLDGCTEVQAGVPISFSLYAMNLCTPAVATIAAIVVSSAINGISASNLMSVPTNSSLTYVTYSWTPQTNQVGDQKMCVIAYTR